MKSCIQIGRPSDNPVADSKIVCKSNIAHTEWCLTNGDARVRKRGCLGATKRERPNMRTIKGISALLLAACSSIASAEGWQLHGFGDISVRNDYVTPRGLVVNTSGAAVQVVNALGIGRANVRTPVTHEQLV